MLKKKKNELRPESPGSRRKRKKVPVTQRRINHTQSADVSYTLLLPICVEFFFTFVWNCVNDLSHLQDLGVLREELQVRHLSLTGFPVSYLSLWKVQPSFQTVRFGVVRTAILDP